uniref:Trafficking protein particle complex subunit n=1 Tax=Arcella intermedia TaxID=1963864 RepID=A0A6B2LNV9_9EUKA
MTSNNHLQIAGVFHSMYAITSQLSPTKETSSGMRSLEADTMRIRCYQSVTGTKFIVIAAPAQDEGGLDSFLSTVYQLYSDFVLKNPFYDLEQPIHNCHKFQVQLEILVATLFPAHATFINK